MMIDTFSSTTHWVNRLDPWVIRFSSNFGIRWYGLAYLCGFLVAAGTFQRFARQGRLPIRSDQTLDLIGMAAAGVLVGGRLGYCFFYNSAEILHNPLKILAVWHGGMASHGGIAGLVLALWLFAYRHQVSVFPLLDAASVAGPIGIVFGRLANFVNGELWGRPSLLPWAVIFPQAPLVAGLQLPRHPSQIYAALLEGVLVFLVTRCFFVQRHPAGMATAAGIITYSVGRFVGEFWREPDLGQSLFFGWMSKGQLLTIPLLAVGILLAIRLRKTVAAIDTV